jgi:trimeric autotransporter adhesin
MPACTTTNFAACYNPDAEFSTSLLDVPHRMIIAPMFELPFGRGKKYGADSAVAEILGDWTLSTIINIQSGFPMAFIQGDNTGLLGGTQRPNIVSGVPLDTSGSYEDRLASADHPSAAWVNRAAFTSAANFTFGNAPRVVDGIRTPVQANVDAVFMKNLRFGTKTVQLRIEELNLLNRVNTNANRNNIGSSNFGTIGVQRGFMRITQLMLRYQF